MALLRPDITPSQENLTSHEEIIPQEVEILQVAAKDATTVESTLAVYAPHEVQQIATLVSPAPTAPINSVSLQEAGFEGLELGSRSFPMISLKTDGLFEDSDGIQYGKKLTCRLISSQSKTAIQAHPVEDNKKDVLFTYDKITSTSGVSVAAWENERITQGKRIEKREYTDALVILDAPGEPHDEELRILSIAPKSRERLAGKLQALAIKNGWSTQELASRIREFPLVCECGPKVMKAQQPFYPWNFTFSK